jgi:hypothetical protein
VALRETVTAATSGVKSILKSDDNLREELLVDQVPILPKVTNIGLQYVIASI